MDPLRAPRVRFSAQQNWVFCSVEHADEFTLPQSSREPERHDPPQTPAPSAAREPSRPQPSGHPLLRVEPSPSYEMTPGGPRVDAQPATVSAGSDSTVLTTEATVGTEAMVGTEATAESNRFIETASDVPESPQDEASAEDEATNVHAQRPARRFASSLPVDLVIVESAPRRPTRTVPPPRASPSVPASPVDEGDASGSSRKTSPSSAAARFAPLRFFPLLLLTLLTLQAMWTGRAFFANLVALGLLTAAHLWETRRVAETNLAWPKELSEGAPCSVRVKQAQGYLSKDADSLRAGEEVLVESGERLVVDGVVSSGEGEVMPWEGARHRLPVVPGTRLVAGARLVAGTISVIATKTAQRRAFHVPLRFVESHALVSIARTASWGAGPVMATICAGLLYLKWGDLGSALATGAVVWASFSLLSGQRVCSAVLVEAWTEAAKRGIAYCSAALFERAGQVNAVVFNARGTVLYGEPDVAEVHVFRGATEQQVLSLAAGAESAVHHPIASSTLRAAHHREVPIDGCRGHHVVAGLGVLCSSSDGRALVVGSRELLLREKVSVAIAEETLRVLESRGMSTLLVALDGRLVGILGLQDSLRAGARATFQLLLESHLEPILLSGDARATTEAVAQSLSCEHVRPEVPALARAHEVRSLIDAGLTIAVVGNSPRDDVALGAAHVPIILDGASIIRADSPHGHERGIGLSSNRVLDAAISVLIARRTRTTLQRCLLAWLLSTATGTLLVLSQLTPIYVAPMMAIFGLVLARYLARRRTGVAFPP